MNKKEEVERTKLEGEVDWKGLDGLEEEEGEGCITKGTVVPKSIEMSGEVFEHWGQWERIQIESEDFSPEV